MSMEKFDRQLQREMLTILINAFPESPGKTEYESSIISECHHLKLAANLLYLHQHQLIHIQRIESVIEPEDWIWLFNYASVTCKGIDFMLNDGGLSAILNVQTVRLHHESIMALEDIIAVANIPEDQRQGLKAALRELPADTIKHLMNELVSKALGAAPAALPIIQKFLSGG